MAMMFEPLLFMADGLRVAERTRDHRVLLPRGVPTSAVGLTVRIKRTLGLQRRGSSIHTEREWSVAQCVDSAQG